MKTRNKIILTVILVLIGAVAVLGATGLLMDLVEEATFYWFDHTETELKVKAFAEDNGLFYSAYPDSLVELLERNPETEQFVLEYPIYEAQGYSLDEYEKCESVPLFMQWDQRWGYEIYGSDVIGITGCGPTCLAMAGFYLTGDGKFTPEQVAAFSWENGYYEKGYGSAWTLMSEGGVKLGLTVTELPLVKKKMTDALEKGNPVILAMGKGDFTSSGHFILLSGVEDGKFIVHDPNSYKNSAKRWSYEELEGQIRNIWEISK